MAPMVSNTKLTQSELSNLYKDLKAEKKRLMNIRKYIEENFENVGDNFSKKVREIYYDKKNNKTIYGTTTAEERDELADEGIDLISVPWIEKDN